MKYLVLAFFVINLFGCATPGKKWEVYSDEIATDMAPLNIRLRGIFARQEKIKDFSILSTKDYLAHAIKQFDPSEQAYKDFLNREDTDVEYLGLGRDFAVCVRNVTLMLTLCDRASSGMVDFVSKDVQIDLKMSARKILSEK